MPASQRSTDASNARAHVSGTAVRVLRRSSESTWTRRPTRTRPKPCLLPQPSLIQDAGAAPSAAKSAPISASSRFRIRISTSQVHAFGDGLDSLVAYRVGRGRGTDVELAAVEWADLEDGLTAIVIDAEVTQMVDARLELRGIRSITGATPSAVTRS